MALTLSKDEQHIRDDSFSTHLIYFWLKSTFTLTSKRIAGSHPNTFMGLFPFGKKEMTYPLKNIAAIQSSTKFHLKKLLMGAGSGYLGYYFLGVESFLPLAILLFLFGAFNILNCYTSTFCITNNAGPEPAIELSILDKSKVQSLVNEINFKIADI